MMDEHKKEMTSEMAKCMNNMADMIYSLPKEEEILSKAIKTPQQLRDSLESLKDGEKLSIQAIQDLSDKLEELQKGFLKEINVIKGQKYGSIRTVYFDDETPSGTKNGVNTDFILKKVPERGSLKIYRNGVRQRVTEDYTLSGQTITFLVAPTSAEIILADYRH
jgi:hypothetical protein